MLTVRKLKSHSVFSLSIYGILVSADPAFHFYTYYHVRKKDPLSTTLVLVNQLAFGYIVLGGITGVQKAVGDPRDDAL